MKKLNRTSDTFNALDFLDKDSPLALDECRDIAEALVIRTGDEKEPHWTDSAETVIGGLTATVVQYGQAEQGTRSLQAVRDILSDPQRWEIAKQLMREHGGMLGRWGGQLEHFKGDELGSVLTTTNRFLRFLDTSAIAENSTRSSFDPSGLRTGKMTTFLVLPPEHARAQSPLLRLWIGSMFRAVLRGGLQESNKVHFVLDEAAALGHMQQLDDAVDKYRGYGVRLQFYYQSLGQLKKCWPGDQGQTLLSNATKVFFGTTELQSAQFISQSLGAGTILVASGGSSDGWQSSTSSGASSSSTSSTYSRNSNRNWQQQKRELLQPDEVMNLSPRTAITLTPGLRPILTTLIRYFEEPQLFRRPGWTQRVTAACRTFIASAVLLAIAIAGAAAATSELSKVIGQQQPLRQASPPTQVVPYYQAPAPASRPPPYRMPRPGNQRVP